MSQPMTQPDPGPSIAVEPIEPPAALDLGLMFGQRGPVEMEIGCGKGGFVLDRARQYPERNFFAVEWANKYYRYAVDRMMRWGMTNVRIMRADARIIVERCTPPACLSALHVYHPDPWPKKRHHKRRLFQPSFVDAVVRILRPGARFAVSTDHAEYFAVIAELTRARAELIEVPFEDPDSGPTEAGVNTNFEIKYRDRGMTIHYLAFVRAE